MAELTDIAGRVRAKPKRSWPVTLSLLAAPLLWLLVFFLLPVALVGSHSVGAVKLFPSDQGLGLDAWRHFFSRGSIPIWRANN